MAFSRIHTSVRAHGCSRCFRTDGEGRITLRRDWPAIFQALQSLDQIALQSRHSYARLIHLGPAPDITWDSARIVGRDGCGALRFHSDLWGESWGRLALCACCDSPGHIDILNARGGEILRLCATPETTASEWASCLTELAVDDAQPAPAPCEVDFPKAPSDAQPLREAIDRLPGLLAALGSEEIPVRFFLRTPEVTHCREFIPRRVSADYPLLTAADSDHTLQLALPPVQQVAVTADLQLHVTGPGNTLLLSLASPTPHMERWRAALAAAFPSLRPFRANL